MVMPTLEIGEMGCLMDMENLIMESKVYKNA